MTEFDESHCPKAGSYIFKILPYLATRGIKRAPVGVWGEGVLIGVCCLLLAAILGGTRATDLQGTSQATPGYLFACLDLLDNRT